MIRFYLLGFPVQIQPFFWLTCVIFGNGLNVHNTQDLLDLLNWTIVMFISIIVHELGHAFAGRRYGAQPAIALHGLGGVTFLPGGRFNRPQHIFVSAAGPIAGFALGALFVGAYFWAGPEAPPTIKSFIRYGLFINIIWTFFNLLPIQPLDGGQILRDILGPKRFTITCWIGAVVGVCLTLGALWIQWYFMAIFAAFLTWSNFKGRTSVPGGVDSQGS